MKHATFKVLDWPRHKPRTKPWNQKPSSFHKRVNNGRYNESRPVDMETAIKRLDKQIQSLCRTQHVNFTLTTGGIGKSGKPISRVDDVGAAVYFQMFGGDIVLACDKWNRAADNIVAIAKHIEALRGQEAWGVSSLEQAFTGHMALPAPMSGGADWRATLNFRVDEYPSRAEINARFRSMAKQHHSDKGGDDGNMASLNSARDAALNSLPEGE